MTMFWIVMAAAAGACISVQAAVNSSLRMHLQDARWATFFSICGTILTGLLVMLVILPSFPSATDLRSAPWWNWIGGVLGAIIVFAGATLTQRLGAASFIAAVVGGQVLCSLWMDHFGLLDLPLHPVTLKRVAGAGLVVAGVILVTRN